MEERIFNEINLLHNDDPVTEKTDEQTIARELLYSNRMVEQLHKLYNKSELHLEIAARCHHLCRWKVNRNEFPKGKIGYYSWRKTVYTHQANITRDLLNQFNVDDELIGRVIKIICKEGIKTDPDVQIIEDVACLVFIKYYINDFSNKHDDETLKNIIKKTLVKMSDKGREKLNSVQLSGKINKLIGNL